MTAQVLSPWIGDGASPETSKRPQLFDDHPLPAGGSWSDVTGQPANNIPPSPNLMVAETTGYDDGWLSAVQADATYTVLWAE